MKNNHRKLSSINKLMIIDCDLPVFNQKAARFRSQHQTDNFSSTQLGVQIEMNTHSSIIKWERVSNSKECLP